MNLAPHRDPDDWEDFDTADEDQFVRCSFRLPSIHSSQQSSASASIPPSPTASSSRPTFAFFDPDLSVRSTVGSPPPPSVFADFPNSKRSKQKKPSIHRNAASNHKMMHSVNLSSHAADDLAMIQRANSSAGSIGAYRPWWRNKLIWYMVAAAMLIFGILAIAISAAMNGGGSESAAPNTGSGSDNPDATRQGPLLPDPVLPEPVVESNKDQLGATLVSIYDQLSLDWSGLSMEIATPQGRALQWVAGSAAWESTDMAQRIQRYAMAVFYYATYAVAHTKEPNPVDWYSSHQWLSDLDECLWEGVVCNANNKVTGILLPGNALSGSLPMELALLDQLTVVDVGSNYLYMQSEVQMDVFLHLGGLETLVLEDNYLVTTTQGLPPQFAALTSLEKLQISYNLLQGALDPLLFTRMTALTHLELESNYLTGNLPSEIGLLPNLVYLYVRRNDLVLDLPKLFQPGRFPSLFSFWMDSNKQVNGPIPTHIGELTDLASFSITNTTLSGPLPTEMGNLINMRRLWLYDNELTGQVPAELGNMNILEVLELHGNDLQGAMPAGTCQAIQQATYEYKSLTADCTQVACTCCTYCYDE